VKAITRAAQQVAAFVRSLSRQMNPHAVTPPDARAAFLLRFGNLTVGKLSVDNGVWTFQYSPAFCARNDMRPLPIFPDLNKVYKSDELWSFFRMRVPSLKQPAVRAIVDKEGIDSNDQIKLLKRFGRRTISNPFELVEDEAPSGMTPALTR
jgi:HipA-like protein